MSALLGLDLGTSSLKAVLLAPSGETLASSAASYPLRTARPGWAESDPDAWWEAAVEAVHGVLALAPEPPAALGLSGQMHGLVLTARDGRATRPAMLWPDRRASAELATYRALPEALRARLGNPLTAGMAGPLLVWAARHEPESYRAARWALQPKDWLRLRATGNAAAEPSDASATLLYDVTADDWNLELVHALGLDEDVLAPLVPSGAVAGTLRREAAEALGLPAELPVATGAGDTAAAIAGSGLREGACQLTLGTGGQIVRPANAAHPHPQLGIHTYRAASPGAWYAMAATLNAGLALDWTRRALGASWEELYATAERPSRTDDPLFLPQLTGERTPYIDPSLRGAWTGLELGHGREQLLRSTLDGVAYALRDALDVLPDATGDLRLAGGGSTHPAWRALLADVLGRPLQAVDVPNVSARGAALLAGTAIGALDPDDERLAPAARLVATPRAREQELHAERMERYRAAVRARLM